MDQCQDATGEVIFQNAKHDTTVLLSSNMENIFKDELSIKIAPYPKPRMTQSDKWNSRECVIKYWLWKDKLNSLIKPEQIPQSCHLIFVIPTPNSWSKKKQLQHLGLPHRQRPDWDNLAKAFFDALYEEDGVISDVRVTKVWGKEGLIIVRKIHDTTVVI